ncbi:RsmD family RNA methyltransferase [Algisphaera agarilytica]|uniref:16S rRNA (Guanine966-N2)-methyltransferase n=1 Tax=Algisphaera agarilytica TaxID=1385975 RepID=A0A7X0LL22_9BACT|nr:RsmD family RNA methyltransferase [Algisphaera agarilytica]MBB6430547.1 16S rRNA (guanine966-N2)-methyltransferase [Algisphaera agarilytica]
MRIIAGKYRGRPLINPEDDLTTRPITDRVKENLFNRLQSLGLLGYGRVLDIYCGTGSMGLEALSRGAEHCTFVDQSRDAIDKLEGNLDNFQIGPEQARVVAGSATPPVWSYPIEDRTVTVAFLDPPYAVTNDMAPFYGILEAILPKLEEGGAAIIRTPAEVEAIEVPGYDGPASITYGKMTLHFYQSPLVEDETEQADV